MSQYKAISSVFVLLALAIAGLWFAKGMHLATPEEVKVVTVSTDDFGDEVKTEKWVKNPDSLDIGLDYAGPGAAVFMGLAIGIFVLGYRKENQ